MNERIAASVVSRGSVRIDELPVANEDVVEEDLRGVVGRIDGHGVAAGGDDIDGGVPDGVRVHASDVGRAAGADDADPEDLLELVELRGGDHHGAAATVDGRAGEMIR